MKRKGLLLAIVLFCSLFMGCQLATTTTLSTPPTTSSIIQTTTPTTQATTSQTTYDLSNYRSEPITRQFVRMGFGERVSSRIKATNATTPGTSTNSRPERMDRSTVVQHPSKWRDAGVEATLTIPPRKRGRCSARKAVGGTIPTSPARSMPSTSIMSSPILSSAADLIDAIDAGRIVLINNDMSKIPYNDNVESRVNRFYTGVTGHYLLVKGYLITDTFTYFEVYDPFNGSSYYADASPRGLNRFYESEALVQSILQWYTKATRLRQPFPRYPPIKSKSTNARKRSCF
ncbi:MAG: hypothetical protein MZU97_21115 [Bacillus subtilis]|nr:hypothetical protein [Bacillus subtilis]